MSHPVIPYTVKPPNSWHMIRSLAGVGLVCSVLIVSAFQATLPIIERKKAEALGKAIFKVLPGAAIRATYRVGPDETIDRVEEEPPRSARLIYVGYDEKERLVGVAIEAQGQGFQDTIRLLYGYAPDREVIIGIEVLESKETPGLGDKILKDPDFLANFEALDVSLTDDGGRVRNPITAVKHGTKQHPWQIDGITGATISSQAVGNILRNSTEALLPVVARQRDEMRRE